MKVLKLLSLFILILGCCVNQHLDKPTAQPQNSQKEMTKHLEDSTAVLLGIINESNYYQTICSGVWVASDKILTAKHCVENDNFIVLGNIIPFKLHSETNLKISLNEYEISKLPHLGQVIAFDRINDLALIKTLDTLNHDIVFISEEEIYDGETISIVGHPSGFEYTYIQGIISNSERYLEPFEDKLHIIQISAPIYFGNSGGGAFDKNGNIIGIVSFMKKDMPSSGFLVHTNEIKKFVQETINF